MFNFIETTQEKKPEQQTCVKVARVVSAIVRAPAVSSLKRRPLEVNRAEGLSLDEDNDVRASAALIVAQSVHEYGFKRPKTGPKSLLKMKRNAADSA
eukprot:3297582-Amphidinium_carterae.1